MRRGAAGQRYGAGLVVASLLAACTFGTTVPSGGGDSEGDETEGHSAATSTGMTTLTATGSGSADDTMPPDDDDEDDDEDDDDDDDDDDDETTTGTVDCGATYHVEAWASEALVVDAPMTVGPGWTDLHATSVAYTAQPGGTLTFAFDIPCAGPHYAWGLVWDRFEGGNACGTEHADSFFVGVDGGDYGVLYAYGCDNCGGGDSQWYWARIRDFTGALSCQDGDPVAPELTVDMHTLSFRGREDGSFVLPEPDVAALAGVVVSNDPEFDLSTILIP